MRSCFPVFSVALLSACGLSASASAADWPNWRGPLNNGICTETDLPKTWSATENVAWRLPLPGSAGATPVIAGERIFLTSVSEEDLVLICVSTDGRELWSRKVSQGNKTVRGDEGNSASPSPCTDGRHVWVMFGDGALACYTVEGEEVWKFNLQERYGRFNIAFGMTSTPVLDGDRLYVQLIHGEGNAETREAVVVGLNALTGAELWKADRPSDAIAECEHSYASPMLYHFGDDRFLLSHGADYTIAHNVDTGAEIWRCGNLNVKDKYDATLRFVASPACAEGIIVVPSAKRGPCVALGIHGSGDISNSDKDHFWTLDKTPDVPSPLIQGDLVYLCMQDGDLQCVDRKTGEEYYLARTHRQRHRASPVYADGHLYLTARDGLVSVVKAGRTFELVAQNEIGESLAASPAISNGTIYLRSFDALWAIRAAR